MYLCALITLEIEDYILQLKHLLPFLPSVHICTLQKHSESKMEKRLWQRKWDAELRRLCLKCRTFNSIKLLEVTLFLNHPCHTALSQPPSAPPPLLAVVVGILAPNKACLSCDTGISVPYHALLALQVVLRPQLLLHRHLWRTLCSRNPFGKLARSVNTQIRYS